MTKPAKKPYPLLPHIPIQPRGVNACKNQPKSPVNGTRQNTEIGKLTTSDSICSFEYRTLSRYIGHRGNYIRCSIIKCLIGVELSSFVIAFFRFKTTRKMYNTHRYIIRKLAAVFLLNTKYNGVLSFFQMTWVMYAFEYTLFSQEPMATLRAKEKNDHRSKFLT